MEDIIPNDTQKIIATLHPSFFKTDTQYPYCSDKNSLAYLVQTKNSQYYQSGLIGGKTKDFLEMARIISEWTSIDLKKNYIPIWHDESYFNKYVSDKNPLILTPNYLWGSFPNKQAIDLFSNDIKIVILNKERLKNTGMDYFRDIELVDIEGDIVKVKLIGVCSACKNATMTLKNFVEAELKEKVDNKIIVEQV